MKKIFPPLALALSPLCALLLFSCTSDTESSTLSDPFSDVTWPDSIVPTNVLGETELVIGDGSSDVLYPPYSTGYFDSGPGHVVLTFEGGGASGTVTADGLPLYISDLDGGLLAVPHDSPRRQDQSTWTITPSSGDQILPPFSMFFQTAPVDAIMNDDGTFTIRERNDVVPRNYAFQDVSLKFLSSAEEGGRMVYRGVFFSGIFTISTGPSHGDSGVDVDGEDNVIPYSLTNKPFVFSTPIPIEPEEEEEEGEAGE